MAVRYEDRFLMMADSIALAGYSHYDGSPKLWSQYGWLIGHTGMTCETYDYWRGMEGQNLTDPGVHTARLKLCREHLEEGGKFESSFLIARGSEAYCINQSGNMWPVGGRWESIGIGEPLVTYFMKRELPVMRVIDEPSLLALGQRVLEAVCDISVGVRLPLIWAWSDTQQVQEYHPDAP